MATKTITKQIQRTKKSFEYVIKVDGREVWRGLNPKKIYWEIRKKNPGKEVGIGVDLGEEILIALI